MNELVEKARKWATQYHCGQKRWDGSSYIEHPLRVSEKFSDPDLKIIALLHDTVEDTDLSLEDIEKEFGSKISKSIDAITKRKDEEYFEFIMNRVRKNKLASLVKIADIEDNILDLKPGSLKDKYKFARYFLMKYWFLD